MMIEQEILERLQKATIAAVASSILPTLPIKHVGRTFTIPDDGKYLEIVYIPNNVKNEFWSDGKTYRGLFRLILHWGLDNAGAYPAMRAIASVSAYFAKGAIFQTEAVRVKVYEAPDLTGVIEVAPEMLFPVTIRYECFQR